MGRVFTLHCTAQLENAVMFGVGRYDERVGAQGGNWREGKKKSFLDFRWGTGLPWAWDAKTVLRMGMAFCSAWALVNGGSGF